MVFPHCKIEVKLAAYKMTGFLDFKIFGAVALPVVALRHVDNGLGYNLMMFLSYLIFL